MKRTTKALPVSTRGWTDDETTEFHALLDAALAAARDSSGRIDALVDGLRAARAQRRPWVKHADADLIRHGAARVMSLWAQRVRHVEVATKTGRVLTKAAVRGVIERDEDSGERWIAQSLVVTWTWDQLREKRRDALKVIRSYGDDVAMYDAYLALAERAPGAASPQEALKALGITEEEWLGDPERRTA